MHFPAPRCERWLPAPPFAALIDGLSFFGFGINFWAVAIFAFFTFGVNNLFIARL